MKQDNPLNKILLDIDFQEAEDQFKKILALKDLDRRISGVSGFLEPFEEALENALFEAFGEEASPESNLFLQRILYGINRLKLFWYDDLRNYENEDSIYLHSTRCRIESNWQEWENKQVDHDELKSLSVIDALRSRVADDLSPEPSETHRFFQKEMTKEGYRRLLQIASLDGLVEASQLSRVLGGVGNEVQSMLTRILLEEYGGGRLARKHSSYFALMLKELGLESKPEAYFKVVPWEVIANINHSFYLCERKRHFLRYAGGLLYTEVSVPAAFECYIQAGKRLGLSKAATGYWDLHIKEDQRHGRWMLEGVVIPLAERYGEDAWELILGYDQQKIISTRVGKATAEMVIKSETIR